LENLYLFILLAIIAEILGTIGGFGSSLFFIPIASYFLDFHSVLGITAIFHVMSNITKIAMFREGVDKNVLIMLGIPSILFVIGGAYLTKFIDSKILEFGLCIFLITTSVTFLYFKNLEIKPNNANSILSGSLSGLIAGLLGTGGAIRGIALAAYNLKIEVFIATSAIIDLGVDFSRSIVYWSNGYMHKDDLYLIPILLVVSVLGTFLGKLILKKISQNQFRTIVLILILVTGISTLIKIVLI